MSFHILGFEKILEVKWQLDKENGNGWEQPQSQLSLFEQDETMQNK